MKPPFRVTPGVLSSAQAVKLEQQVVEVAKERDNFKEAVLAKDEEIQKLSVDKSRFQSQLTAKDREIVRLSDEKVQIANQLTAKDQRIEQLSGQLNELKLANTQASTLAAEKMQLSSRIAKLEGDVSGKDAIIKGHQDEIKQLKARPFDQLTAEKQQLSVQVINLQDSIKVKDGIIAENLKKIGELEARPIPPSAGAAAGDKAKPTIMPISTAMANIGSQVFEAQKQLKTQNFAINNVAVKLRAKADSADGTIKIFDPRSDAVAEALDEINFGISTGSGEAETPKSKVPDVQGLTVTAATRLLADKGLRIDAVTGQAPKNAGVTSGQAYKQSPAANIDADRGSSVMVIFEQ
ncbi:MAG: PASTA domain-containing protein [Sphingomonadales bacterium]|nr:PASTA domain-containing protein [Sphingomonadales bacterium]